MEKVIDPNDGPPVVIWLEEGETKDEALLARYGAGPYPANLLVIGWATTAEQATLDPSRGGDDEGA